MPKRITARASAIFAYRLISRHLFSPLSFLRAGGVEGPPEWPVDLPRCAPSHSWRIRRSPSASSCRARSRRNSTHLQSPDYRSEAFSGKSTRRTSACGAHTVRDCSGCTARRWIHRYPYLSSCGSFHGRAACRAYVAIAPISTGGYIPFAAAAGTAFGTAIGTPEHARRMQAFVVSSFFHGSSDSFRLCRSVTPLRCRRATRRSGCPAPLPMR